MIVALPLSREWAPQRRAHKVHAVVEFAELAGAEAAVKELTDNSNWRTGLRVKPLLRKDALAALFLAGMGIADLSFAGVFATAAVKAFMEEEKKTKTA